VIKTMKLISIFKLLLAVGLLGMNSCTYESEDKDKISALLQKNLNNYFNEAFRKNDLTETPLAEAIRFDEWDKVCLIKPYASVKDVSISLGFNYSGPVPDSDGFWTILLIKETFVIARLDIDAQVIGYQEGINNQASCIKKETAFFRITKNDRQKYIMQFN
jgi:hypothetical protein